MFGVNERKVGQAIDCGVECDISALQAFEKFSELVAIHAVLLVSPRSRLPKRRGSTYDVHRLHMARAASLPHRALPLALHYALPFALPFAMLRQPAMASVTQNRGRSTVSNFEVGISRRHPGDGWDWDPNACRWELRSDRFSGLSIWNQYDQPAQLPVLVDQLAFDPDFALPRAGCRQGLELLEGGV